MHSKDYYRILELEPSATQAEIKKAYRRLALLHHPDKNNADPYSTALFEEIKEAYEVLTTPSRKEQYLQQRWYNQSIGKRSTHEVITPVSILKQALELDRYVSKLDVHRMDREGLMNYIITFLSDDTVKKINHFNEPATNREIVRAVLHGSLPLQAAQFDKVATQLYKLSADPSLQLLVEQQRKRLRQQQQRDRYIPWIILAVTIGICLLIFILNG